jgi:hypothetical protein
MIALDVDAAPVRFRDTLADMQPEPASARSAGIVFYKKYVHTS